jgi:heat shock protein HtpX
MADYYSLLTKLIAGLTHSTPETRRQMYERARQALLRHLQNAQPPFSPSEIEQEISAFDTAVAQFEVELAVEAALANPEPASHEAAPEDHHESPPSFSTSTQDSDYHPVGNPKVPQVAALRVRWDVWKNSIKSIFLIVGFPFVLPFVVFCAAFGPLYFLGSRDAYPTARVLSVTVVIFMLGITAAWLPVAYFISQWIIDRATGARLLTHSDDLRVWTLLKKLCARCDMRMPQLRVIETDELNAYASGMSNATYSVTVTEGLMASLNDAELEAVLAHELTHILNRDVRLRVVAAILVGIVPIMETICIRSFWYLMNGFSKLYEGIFTILRVPGAVLTIKLAYGLCFIAGKCFAIVVGSIGHFCSLLLNFSLSRRREFMADAGAVAITNDADAMISALRKISGHSDIPAALANVRQMFFDNPRLSGFEGFFATHPSIQSRIDALMPYARNSPIDRRSGLSPAGVWSDKAADFFGIGLLVCAIATMTYLAFTAPDTVQVQTTQISNAYVASPVTAALPYQQIPPPNLNPPQQPSAPAIIQAPLELQNSSGAPAPATPWESIQRQCSQKYQAAKAENSLGGQTWTPFYEQCAAELKEVPEVAKERSASSIECSNEAEARGLHGEERLKFRERCKAFPATAIPNSDAVVPHFSAPAPPQPEPAPTATMAPAGPAVFPIAISPQYANESPSTAREKTCLDQYRANKATNSNGGLRWVEKGDGYYSECNEKL